jgi:hypothetical protein
MTSPSVVNGRTWNAGRFHLRLPQSATLSGQQQVLDGITISFQPAAASPSVEPALAHRRAELAGNPRTPVISQQVWRSDRGAVMYVADISDPDYYQVEGRRSLPQSTMVAVTSGDKSNADLLYQMTQQILGSFFPAEAPDSTGFGVPEGTLHQAFRNQEEVHATFALPDIASDFEFNTAVVAAPAKLDLYQREEKAIAIGKMDGLIFEVVRKDHANIAGQTGDEMVITTVEKGVRHFDARLETAGTAVSGRQPQIKLHLHTEGPSAGAVTENQFLEEWDSIISTVQAHD